MPSPSFLPAGLALTALALGGGWWLGARPSSPPPAAVPAAAPAGDTAAAAPENLSARLDALRRGPKGFARRRALLEFAALARTPRELRALLDTGATGPLTEVLLTRWAEQDPAGAWAWLKAGGPSGSGGADLFQMRALPVFFTAWFRKDPEAALRAARSAGQAQWIFAAAGISGLMFSDDPRIRAAVAAHLDELCADGRSNTAVYSRPLVEVTAGISALPPSAVRDTLMDQLAERHFGENWESAVKWAGTLPPEERTRLLTRMAGKSVGILRELMKQARNPDSPEAGPARAAAAAAAPAFAWAREWLETGASSAEKQRLAPAAVRIMADSDPAGAAAWARAHLKGLSLITAMGDVLSTQADRDPAAARALLETLPPGAVRTQATARLAEAWGFQDPPAALAWLLEGTDSKTAGTAGALIAGRWTYHDPAAVRAWISASGPAALPKPLLDNVLSLLPQRDPSGTLAWALTLDPGDTRNQAVQQSFGALMRSDPAAAAQQLAANPALAESDNRVRALTYAWFERDPAAVIDWSRGLPPAARAAAGEALTQSLETSTRLSGTEKTALRARLTGPNSPPGP